MNRSCLAGNRGDAPRLRYFLPERSVDPRKLGSALEKAARNCGVDFATGSAVTEVAVLGGRATGVRTTKSFYAAATVVNCAGAWAAQIKPFGAPTRPVKGPDAVRGATAEAGAAHPLPAR